MKATEDPRWTALSPKRRQALLEEHRDVNVDHDWWDFTYEAFVEDLLERGLAVNYKTVCVAGYRGRREYNEPDIAFSGFWSQGDGACFAARVDDWAKALTAIGMTEFIGAADEHGFRFMSGTSRHNNMTFSSEIEFPDNPHDEEDAPLQYDAFRLTQPGEKEADALIEKLETWFNELADKLYSDLEDEYDHLTDDEQVVDWILNNLDDDELADPDAPTDEEEELDMAASILSFFNR